MTIVEAYQEDASRILDRLVDGELSQTDRRMLLAALDDQPDGWRRCALAFLENQSWRWQLAQMAAEPMVAQATATAPESNAGHAANSRGVSRGVSRGTLWGVCLASAASVFVAFGLGTRYAGTAVPLAELSQAPQSEKPVVGPAANAVRDQSDHPQQDRALADSVSQPQSKSAWELLTLTAASDVPGPLANKAIQLPVRAAESESIDLEQLLASESSAPSAALVRQLEEEGWTVTRQRHLIPVDLSDGRRMVMPVEQVDLRPPELSSL